MGMTIDKTIEFFTGLECHTPQAKDARDVAIETMRKYQQLQADYEKRLKADMVAMLEDLKKSIEDKVYNVSAYSECLDCDVVDYEDVNEIIIEKINSLKGQ